MMRIGVDASCWSNRRGFGRFTRELLTCLVRIDEDNQYWFFVDQQTAESHRFPDRATMITLPTSEAPSQAASATGRRSFRDVWAMTRGVLDYSVDLFFFPAIYSYFPILNRTKIVLTVHDAIPHLYPKSVFPDRRRKFFWAIKERMALLQADLVVTVTQYSKQQIMREHGLSASQVRIVSEAAGCAFRVLPRDNEMFRILAQNGMQETDRFLLHVGGISPHKNLGRLITSFSRLVRLADLSDLKLVLAGDYEKDSFYSDYPNLVKQIRDLRLENQVIFTGFIEDADLACLYNAAALLVFPSLQEGFGLPALEAMSCGTPVVASKSGSLPEVLGEAAEFFDPYNVEEMTAALARVLRCPDLQERMRQAGLERVKQFDWQKASTDLLGVFAELKSNAKSGAS